MQGIRVQPKLLRRSQIEAVEERRSQAGIAANPVDQRGVDRERSVVYDELEVSGSKAEGSIALRSLEIRVENTHVVAFSRCREARIDAERAREAVRQTQD